MQRGFTLLELIVVMAIVVVLAVVSVPLLNRLQTANVLAVQKDQMLLVLRRAQTQSFSGLNNASHGVAFTMNTYTLYEGDDYANRLSSNDEVFDTLDNISVSGLTDITFNQKTGTPVLGGTITLTNTIDNQVLTITINDEGAIF